LHGADKSFPVKDYEQRKSEILGRVFSVCIKQLADCEKQLEDLVSIAPAAKTTRERTAINIIVDDQRKVARALTRLQHDLSEVIEN
jgi:hypothetical protein